MNKVIKTHPSISLQRLLQKNACPRKNSDKRSKKSVGRNVRGRIAFKKASMRKEEAVKVRRGEGHGNNQRKKKRKKCEVYECEVSDEGGQHLAAPSVKSSL